MRSLIYAVICSTLAGCGDIYRYVSSGEVGWALKQAVRDRPGKEVTIAMLTKFDWDEFHLFGPYYPTGEICKRLALSQADCASTIKSESTSDGEMMMAFRYQGKVVHSEMHFRWNGDFTPVPQKALTPESAVFTVSPEGKGAGGAEWLKLRQKAAVRK